MGDWPHTEEPLVMKIKQTPRAGIQGKDSSGRPWALPWRPAQHSSCLAPRATLGLMPRAPRQADVMPRAPRQGVSAAAAMG